MSEKCCLVIPQIKGKKDWDSEDLIGELRLLTKTARGVIKNIFVVNKDIGAGEKKIFLVLNKIDLLSMEERKRILREYKEAVSISAKTKEGLKELSSRLLHLLGDDREYIKVSFPQSEGYLLWQIHERGVILRKGYENGRIILEARVSKSFVQKLKPYMKMS